MTAAPDLDALRARIDAHHPWYHRIEIAPGLITPGIHDSAAGIGVLDELGLASDLTGARVLDIGCRDGAFSFEAERRGAEVVGIDYAAPENTGFSIASQALGSRVEFRTLNVYDLDPDDLGRFDVVLFLGVLYHLRNPLLALDRLRAVTATGGEIFVETEMTREPELIGTSTPAFEFIPRDSLDGDGTNTWAPNLAGLRAAVEESQYVVSADHIVGNRGWVRARAVEDRQLEWFRTLDSSVGRMGRS